MLNQLRHLLVELNHIWLSMDKVLNLFPGRKVLLAALSLTASEAIDNLAEHLTSCEGLHLGLLDSEDVIIALKSHVRESIEHLFLNLNVAQRTLSVDISTVVGQIRLIRTEAGRSFAATEVTNFVDLESLYNWHVLL